MASGASRPWTRDTDPAGLAPTLMRGGGATLTSLDQLDRTSGESRDQADTEGDVAPAFLAHCRGLERKAGPDVGIARLRHRSPLVRMPDRRAIAIVQEPLVQ